MGPEVWRWNDSAGCNLVGAAVEGVIEAAPPGLADWAEASRVLLPRVHETRAGEAEGLEPGAGWDWVSKSGDFAEVVCRTVGHRALRPGEREDVSAEGDWGEPLQSVEAGVELRRGVWSEVAWVDEPRGGGALVVFLPGDERRVDDPEVEVRADSGAGDNWAGIRGAASAGPD